MPTRRQLFKALAALPFGVFAAKRAQATPLRVIRSHRGEALMQHMRRMLDRMPVGCYPTRFYWTKEMREDICSYLIRERRFVNTMKLDTGETGIEVFGIPAVVARRRHLLEPELLWKTIEGGHEASSSGR